MRQAYFVFILLMGTTLSGWAQEKAEVETYLRELKASNHALVDIAEGMETSMGGLQDKIASGDFDGEQIKAEIAAFAGRMTAQKVKLEGLNVPPKANALHLTTLRQYEIAVALLMDKTPKMIDIASEMSATSRKAKASTERDQQDILMTQLQAEQARMEAVQAESLALSAENRELEASAKAQKEKLCEEFDIPADPVYPRTGRPD